ncbi:isopenicillin N synthase family oxygenase [Komagataeibacter melaceti]|uniref:2-oxoglutarate-dependent ethylene/succinate-forming enzyme n=1 Tax=Komagataeibacter melaceti TaxID=2766577 RepID=A0A371YX61_9PROT|nr:2-oxoglutarate and iron-dependent oxygenase domain-containing protein [Komagataeibacter melaceti]RFD18836.1 isopenicillin N synthase family oxygenase [Komagataeibacter melaceti]
MSHDIPVIDITRLREGTPAERREVAAALGRACRETGFFYITGHGVDPSLLRAVFDASHALFALPDAEKERIARSRVGHNRGYVGYGVERLDTAALPDRKEAFNMGREAAGEPANAWPDIPGWRDLMVGYFAACQSVGASLHRAFALDLGVDEDFFVDKFTHPMATLRLLHYCAAEPRPRAPGAGAHTDYGNVTILAVDGVAGLQVRPRGGDWIDAPMIPDAFVCNIGDCLMRWSNDVYVSTPHRVLQPASDRYSVAFFLDPDADAVVEPIMARPGDTPHYPPITGADYLRERLEATYGHTP